MLKSQRSPSLIITWLIVLVIAFSHILLPKWDYEFYTNELGWDVLSYYLYLPLTFIHNDICIKDFTIITTLFEKYHPSETFYQAFQIQNGNYVLNYTLGFALLFSPFFFIGHIWALLSNYPADGFSFPYHFSIATGVMIYILAGIFILRKVLLKYFTEKVTSVVLIFMLLGTNYFHEAVQDYMMPHAMLFTFYALFIYLVIKWHEKPKARTAFFIGLSFGILFLCRQSEVLAAIVILLWGVHNKETFQAKIILVKENYGHVLWMIAAGFIVVIPQMIYWKTVTGSWIFFSMERTEGFNLLAPHIWESLFSFKNSWFIYTPMIIFAWLGMISLYRRKRELFYPIFLFAIVNFYLLSSWLAWWNGGGFGMRYFVESYVLMSIPFGFFIQGLFERWKSVQVLVIILMVGFMALNLWQTWQYAHFVMPHDGKNIAFYKANFFRTKGDPEVWRLLDVQRKHGEFEEFSNPEDYNKKTVGYYNYSDINTSYISPDYQDSTVFFSPPYSCKLTKEYPYSPVVRIPFNALTSREHAWVRVTVKYFPIYDLKENPASIVVHMDYLKRNFYYRGFDLDKYPYKLNEWNTISFDYLTPYPFDFEKEKLSAYLWLRGDKPIYFDDFHVEAFERKW